jgi:hypothetical protein
MYWGYYNKYIKYCIWIICICHLSSLLNFLDTFYVNVCFSSNFWNLMYQYWTGILSTIFTGQLWILKSISFNKFSIKQTTYIILKNNIWQKIFLVRLYLMSMTKGFFSVCFIQVSHILLTANNSSYRKVFMTFIFMEGQLKYSLKYKVKVKSWKFQLSSGTCLKHCQ